MGCRSSDPLLGIAVLSDLFCLVFYLFVSAFILLMTIFFLRGP